MPVVGKNEEEIRSIEGDEKVGNSTMEEAVPELEESVNHNMNKNTLEEKEEVNGNMQKEDNKPMQKANVAELDNKAKANPNLASNHADKGLLAEVVTTERRFLEWLVGRNFSDEDFNQFLGNGKEYFAHRNEFLKTIEENS